MKKPIPVLGRILFALVALLPFRLLLSFLTGYTFELASVSVFVIVTALLSIYLVFLSVAVKESVVFISDKVLFALLAPLSLISAVLYIIESCKIWITVGVFVCVVCCFALTIKHGKPLALKIITIALSVLMIVPISFFFLVALTMGILDIDPNSVVRSVESPNGAYYAEVIDNDQGALGGNTIVDVHDNKGINMFIYKIKKKTQRVYIGPWGEFENMRIYWKEDDRLVINSIEYDIK